MDLDAAGHREFCDELEERAPTLEPAPTAPSSEQVTPHRYSQSASQMSHPVSHMSHPVSQSDSECVSEQCEGVAHEQCVTDQCMRGGIFCMQCVVSPCAVLPVRMTLL